MNKEYKVAYEFTIIYSGFFGPKEITKNGIEIISADSYSDAQKIMDEKFQKAVDSASGNIVVLPSIKSIEQIKNT